MKLIDKDTLVAEIKRIQNEFSDNVDKNGNFDELENQGVYKALDILESFLDTLKVKEVDLEKEIKNEIDNLCELYCYMIELSKEDDEGEIYPIPEKVTNELFEFAKHFFELGLKVQKGK